MVKIICHEEQEQAQDIFKAIQPKFEEIIVVNSQGDIDRFMVEIKFLKDKKKILEEKRKSITNPLDTAKKNTQAIFNPMKLAIDTAIGDRESAILTFKRAEEETARKKEEELRASQPVPKDEVEEMEQEAQLAQVAETPKVKGVTKYYSMEIIDENKVPRHCLIPDTQGLNALARARKEKFDIPGCKLIVKEVIK